MAKTVTVFGSSKPVDDDEQYVTGYQIGKKLAEKGFNVCTGGFGGIMEAVSKGANEMGAEAIGVTIDTWGRMPNKYLTREVKCSSIFERVEKLIELGDGFAVLQGGTGTLLELAAVWELCNKNIMDRKPVACHSSMWKEIIAILNVQMEKENRSTETVKVFENVDQIVSYLSTSLVDN
jgi:uncharacterized protein (TIGR00730 family)